MGEKEQLLSVNTRTCVNCIIRNRTTKNVFDYIFLLDPVYGKKHLIKQYLLYKFDIV